jgi:hypothetical protein
LEHLNQLYHEQPELADEAARSATACQLDQLVNDLGSLRLEQTSLEEKIESDNGGMALSRSLSSPVLWQDPNNTISNDSEDDSEYEDANSEHADKAQSPNLNDIRPSESPLQVKARVLFDFEATDPEHELTIRRGQELTILSKDGEWCQAELDGKIGYVPLNYVHEGLLW